ncbi:histidine kinase/DNA gyrase B/HSP90-like ATPase [Salinibacterium amurskyense]|uniref:Histidine kinase/DNA gyrase B/HSP90-like ATPase n=1 Tax=Salinibacterium amurskyense TaxID=205941 RepID=A0A2M9DA43_9MICO|nr:ATP-binding protein [Salinibacterium amurskyense]PJJ82601.1 histidine kinase/DNA gyrase B/HSP90-like ATPase [Salinibacterium amurskyense]RLQ82328.1 hypothetical protein D9C83_08955 [Salinibacterium amurskyense]GHD76360.1 hypothetical protein GCM10007394_00290 [Salinibacterium amurskyense]
MSDENSVEFSFSWLALRLLGRGLYSNPWSALSELVANGFDAGADTVYLYIDMKDKTKATVEVFDNGTGMDVDGLRLYATVGYDKRAAAQTSLDAQMKDDDGDVIEKPPATDYMGRKGIGKLAALYLSQEFFIRTKTNTSDTTWTLDAGAASNEPDGIPSLQRSEGLPPSPVLGRWEPFDTGTFVSLRNVDLRGYGEQGLKMLRARLANQFLLKARDKNESTREIKVRVDGNDDTKDSDFKRAQKRIAFGNLAYVEANFPNYADMPNQLTSEAAEVLLPAPGLLDKMYRHERSIHRFVASPDTASPEWKNIAERVDIEKSEFDGYKYELTGWLGVHASIEKDAARLNDPLFDKNRYYNPAQIRLYVRGKLASDRLLGQLGLTGTYTNYIEGEISFDFLDHDEFPDIATSNRQDYDETDGRVKLLRALLRPLVRGLVSKRQNLAKEIRKLESDRKQKAAAAGKEQFAKTLNSDLASMSELSEDTRNEIQFLAVNKIKGAVEAKTDYRIFISHSSADAAFTNFLYELLLSRGAQPNEIFYTSKPDEISQYSDPNALASVVRESIRSANTLLFYFVSHNFRASQYCMFEGGAGWVTRSVREFLMLSTTYSEIPNFLTQGESQMSLLDSTGGITLRPDLHNYIIECLLNPMISHLNRGREIEGTKEMNLFEKSEFPTQVILDRENKVKEDYFDPTIVEHWASHIGPKATEYIALRAKASRRAKAASDAE